MSRLLLLEDDISLGETLKERLEREHYEVDWVTRVADAEKKVASEIYDLLILDIGLPDGSGFSLARHCREGRTDGRGVPPFLFMTALNSAEHRLAGFELGAEEFIPKPFHLKELLMRVEHVLKSHRREDEFKKADWPGGFIDFSARQVVRHSGEKAFLPERDAQLLKLLIQMAPTVVSRDEILNRVWGEDKFPSHRTVDNAIVRLRQVLGDEGGQFIRSARGVGYHWVAVEEK